jgi:multisubunit Na+/H+ antiporter MnhF subunit
MPAAPADAMHPYREPGEIKPPTPGGTSGGTGQFLFGLGMLIVGGYLFLDNVVVRTSYRELFGFGAGAFGLSLIPLLLGVGLLFFDGKSLAGKILTAGGFLIIIAGIIARLTVHYRPLSLFDTILILVLIAGGIGLVARSLREQ